MKKVAQTGPKFGTISQLGYTSLSPNTTNLYFNFQKKTRATVPNFEHLVIICTPDYSYLTPNWNNKNFILWYVRTSMGRLTHVQFDFNILRSNAPDTLNQFSLNFIYHNPRLNDLVVFSETLVVPRW